MSANYWATEIMARCAEHKAILAAIHAYGDARIREARLVPAEDEGPDIHRPGHDTYCPVEGVHPHAFRGPHHFREWDPDKPAEDEGRLREAAADVVRIAETKPSQGGSTANIVAAIGRLRAALAASPEPWTDPKG